MNEDTDLLADQVAFYRTRAPEYDEWWQRRGRYNLGPAQAAEWNAEVAELESELERFSPHGDVLELAGGTGWWTERLARTARNLTVVDTSPEAMALNRRRVERDDVSYVEEDLFTWRPKSAHTHDVVFFSFWLSHVPPGRFDPFWAFVARCLAPGGRVFFIDSRADPTSARRDPYVIDEEPGVQSRRLGDGSVHRVVKLFYEPAALTQRLEECGWEAQVSATRRFFIYGTARPRTG